MEDLVDRRFHVRAYVDVVRVLRCEVLLENDIVGYPFHRHIFPGAVAVVDHVLAGLFREGRLAVRPRLFTVRRQGPVRIEVQFVALRRALVGGHVPMGRAVGGHRLPVGPAVVAPVGGHVAYRFPARAPGVQHPVAALDRRQQEGVLADIGRLRQDIGQELERVLDLQQKSGLLVKGHAAIF